jgi:hypothetical protein
MVGPVSKRICWGKHMFEAVKKGLFVAILAVVAIVGAGSSAQANVFNPYWNVSVTNSVNGPVWLITSDHDNPYPSTLCCGGLELQLTGPTFTLNDLTTLSAMYETMQGTFGGGSPRFTIFDMSFNSAWLYWGTPQGGGTYTDPTPGSFASTGNLADDMIAVYVDGFGGVNSPNTPMTMLAFKALAGSTAISYITLDVDGGWLSTQQLITNAFTVNDAVYNPTLSAPEPAAWAMTAIAFLSLLGLGLMRRRVAA